MENVDIRCAGLRLPASARLPGVRRFADVARQLAYGRVAVAWEALGVATGVFEATLRYAQQREQFGRPISSFQLIQDKLVTMLEHLTAMQAMLMAAARHEQRQGGLDETRASLCKLVCARRAREVCALGRGVLGGNGILLQHGVARLFADMEAIYSYEGTEEMNTLIVGRGITGHSAFV
jgi:glutaryl-CoA dehydrogenase